MTIFVVLSIYPIARPVKAFADPNLDMIYNCIEACYESAILLYQIEKTERFVVGND